MSAPLSREVIDELHAELRAAAERILRSATSLRHETAAPSKDAEQVRRIIDVSGELLARIDHAFAPATATTAEDVAHLVADLAAPQASVLAATTVLLWGGRGGRFSADVEGIAEAARRLTAVPRPEPVPTARTNHAPTAALQTVAEGPPPGAASAARDAGKGRILVVDDLEDNRVLLECRLRAEGYVVESVASGVDALARVGRGAFDLVLLDVVMPDLDGFAVLERIKADPETRNIPVIMISALHDLASVVRCIEHGAEDYLTKSFDPVLLRARIGASLERKRWHDREADYIRQVGQITDAAGAVEQGTYVPGALARTAARDDALGRLARVFDSMAAGVRSREARLREQLRTLRADVSLATRAAQASAAGGFDESDALAPGALLASRYEILGVVGRGGMGVVYSAHDHELDEQVAVKTIHRRLLADNPTLAELFKSELRLARRISHRNVVRMHDFAEADGLSFVTMEYVRGITVRELLTTHGKLGAASTLALARQLAEALAVAHAAGVIHRDVKPENALIDGDGVLKVMDFGIARLAEVPLSRTQRGMLVGTPTYMAPEQLIGDEVDARADLYALGVVMYECLTGRPPFEANTVAGLIGRVITTDAEPPATVTVDVPPALSELVMRLLAKEPGERPADASSLLERFSEIG